MKKYLAVLTACLLTFSACGEKAPAMSAPREASEIIREIIRTKGENPNAEPAALFEELKTADPAQAELWHSITDYWSYCDTMPIYENELPEELPGGNTLGIVVLGYALKADGSMQEELIGRLTTALHCAEQYPQAIVICTGGGTASENSEASEAGEMAKWLVRHGVSETRILVEDRSLSTVENAVLSLALIEQEQPQVTDVAIVSSSYHIGWGSLLFETVFLQSAAAGGTERHVISNAAYPYINPSFRDNRGYQIGGLLSLADTGN